MNAIHHLTRRCASSRGSIIASSRSSSSWSSSSTTPITPTTTQQRHLVSSPSPLPLFSLLPNHHNHCPHPNTIRTIHASTSSSSPDRHGTTIVCVRKNGRVCMMGDGMVSMGSIIVKPNAKKIRRIQPKNINTESGGGGSSSKSIGDEESDQLKKGDDNNNNTSDGGTIVGFAGTTADAFTLLERLESKLDEYPGQLARSCVELAKGWRTDKYLRRLEASLLVADAKASFEITGNGDVLESHDGVLGVGSGSAYAMAAARALMEEPNLSAEDVAKRAMRIASEMCIYTNDNFTMESMAVVEKDEDEKRMDE